MLHGDILGFLRGSIQVTIADFGNPLAGTSVSGSVDQRLVQTIQEKAEEVVKGVFGRRLASVLGSVSSKLLVIRRITFSGSLEDFRARLAVNVAYVAGGTADTMVVSIEARSLDAFAEHVGREVVRQSRAAFEAVIAEAERVVAEQAAAALAEASRKALSEMRARASEALSVARRTDEAEARAAEDARRRLASAAHAVGSTGRQFQSVVRKAHDTFREFGEFTEAVATRVFDKPIRELTNAWDQLEKELKRAFTSADNEELVMKDGPAFNIFTRLAGGAVLAAPAVTRKNYPVSARPPGRGISDAWQLVPNDKITEGSFFLVSAYSGLLVAKPRDTHLSLIPHESDHKDRERMLMEAVPDEPGWYFLKYRDTYVRDRVRYQTYAELRSVVFDDAGALAKNPGFELRVPQWVLAPVAYPAGSRPGDMGKFRFQIAGDIDWRASKSLPPRMTVAAGLREGGRYGAAGEPEQFVYTGGTFRWIPDPETLAAGGWAAQPLVMLSFGQRIGMILGPPLPTRVDGALLQVQGRPEVFIMDQGRRRWIPDAATFQNLGLHTDRIQVVTRADLDAIHSGDPLPSVVPKVALHDRVLYQVPGDATVFVIRESTARAVPDPETLVAMGYDWSMVVTASAADLSAVRRGGRLPSRKDGALVRADGHPEVYVMEKALRRHIPDPETFRARGLEWGNVQVVSSTDLTDIPIGPSIPSARRAVPGAVPAAPSSDMAT